MATSANNIYPWTPSIEIPRVYSQVRLSGESQWRLIRQSEPCDTPLLAHQFIIGRESAATRTAIQVGLVSYYQRVRCTDWAWLAVRLYWGVPHCTNITNLLLQYE